MFDKNSRNSFTILGQQILFNPEGMPGLDPKKVVEFIQHEADVIQKKNPSAEIAQLAVLVALKIAADKLTLEGQLKDNMKNIETKIEEAISLIQESNPRREQGLGFSSGSAQSPLVS